MVQPLTTPQDPIYRDGSRAQRQVHTAGTIAALTAVACIAWSVLSALYPPVRSQLVSGGLAALWLIGAPVWFWYEYYFIYRGKDGGLPGSLDHFKHGQQLAVAIWAGLSAVLGAFAASDYARPPAISQSAVQALANQTTPHPHPPASRP